MAQVTPDRGGPRLKALVVDDEPSILDFIKLGLGYEGFDVKTARDGPNGLALARDYNPDVIVLDVMLPGMDGMEVCQRIRAQSDAGIVMLTARDELQDRILGLERGADDYVVKPFRFEELIARIRAVLRRRGTTRQQVLTFADLTLDQDTREVHRGERLVELTPREHDLLKLFMFNQRQVLSKDTILERVWGYDFEGDANIVEVYVRYLREKLADIPPKLIQTVRGVGYILKET
ncbi:MAG TPA: response regulator transcription factor [Chloroflexota bacterium]|nr:response regulator transcription factor [Chloroflexota bacterium]